MGKLTLLYCPTLVAKGCQQMVCTPSHVWHSWQCWECEEAAKPSSIWYAQSKQGTSWTMHSWIKNLKLSWAPLFRLKQVYSLVGGFCGSPVNFHAKDGSGYKFLGEMAVQLDKINPQVCQHKCPMGTVCFRGIYLWCLPLGGWQPNPAWPSRPHLSSQLALAKFIEALLFSPDFCLFCSSYLDRTYKNLFQ